MKPMPNLNINDDNTKLQSMSLVLQALHLQDVKPDGKLHSPKLGIQKVISEWTFQCSFDE